MNKNLWKVRKALESFLKKVIKSIKSVYFQPTTEELKTLLYEELPAPVAWESITRGRKLFVEIGSGHGEVLLANNSESSVTVGYEIKSRFFRLTQRKIRKREDIFVFKGSGYESLFLHYKDFSIDRIFALFPDPWHKKKHNKRRPLTAELFRKLTQKLKSKGEIVIATDWQDYADFIKEQAKLVEDVYTVTVKPYEPTEFELPITHFHQKWVRKGRNFTLIFLKKQA